MVSTTSMGGAEGERRRHRCRSDRGAALVEFALVGPLLFMLLVGMFTGGVLFNERLAITNGVREGSRYGATLPVAAAPCPSGNQLDCWLRQVASVTLQASEGKLNSGVAGRSVCIAYVSPGTTAVDQTRRITVTGTQTAATGTITTGSTCFSDARPQSERRVQVQGSRQGKIEWVLGSSTPTLASGSVTKFEAAT